MCNHNNQYFEKTENDTTYRIYLMDYGADPWLCRSALDEADGVHVELVLRVNHVVGRVYDDILDNYVSIIGWDSAHRIARDAVRSFIVVAMEHAGWTMFSE